ncbi:MAG TPA: neuraminidase-like domain-containing protein [Candidatus Angelobacter sp.]
MASSALSVLKARYSSNDWLGIAPPIINPIRENRSTALQSYLIAQRDGAGNLIYGDVNGLFDHFLIDVQMSSCEVSTRISRRNGDVNQNLY